MTKPDRRSATYPYGLYAEDSRNDLELLQTWWHHAHVLAAARTAQGTWDGGPEPDPDWALAWELAEHTDLQIESVRHEECDNCGAEAERQETNNPNTYQLLACPTEHVRYCWHLGKCQQDERTLYGWAVNPLVDGYPSEGLVALLRRLETAGHIAPYVPVAPTLNELTGP